MVSSRLQNLVWSEFTSELPASEWQGNFSPLVRFGIVVSSHAVGNSYGHPQWTVDVSGVDYVARFLDAIGAHGPRPELRSESSRATA